VHIDYVICPPTRIPGVSTAIRLTEPRISPEVRRLLGHGSIALKCALNGPTRIWTFSITPTYDVWRGHSWTAGLVPDWTMMLESTALPCSADQADQAARGLCIQEPLYVIQHDISFTQEDPP